MVGLCGRGAEELLRMMHYQIMTTRSVGGGEEEGWALTIRMSIDHHHHSEIVRWFLFNENNDPLDGAIYLLDTYITYVLC